MDVAKLSAAKTSDKWYGYKKQISVALPQVDRLQVGEPYKPSTYLYLPEYQSE